MDIIRSEKLEHGKKHLTPWHRHADGQLYWLTRGMIALETPDRQWALTAGCIGWFPPHLAHRACAFGNMTGLSLHLAAEYCRDLPGAPQIFSANALLQALAERIASLNACALTAKHLRLIQVLIDELSSAPTIASHLPLPQDGRALNIAREILENPDDPRTQAQWAGWGGLSARTLSRLFLAQTGIGFAHWRQQARLLRSLALLANGDAVGNVAAACGYENVSAYIAVFRRRFGVTPGSYFAKG
ncbi:helix-turn-helix transcriptional regulator [Brenneria populi]|uniref:Helix-turn-helix transcriptional regulator n=1 Tax=Brenneria populi TaxID=1505588 RepID=A0ABU6JNP9_9GAMM|nr:helix-turn-helix transcriptional regulator [Brenneria populi Li et al. 2015]